ncbi:MAG: hypothetical protein AB8G18_07655 [Gammaproteobacteria bacterium]
MNTAPLPDQQPDSLTEKEVTAQFEKLLNEGCHLKPQGTAKADPRKKLVRQKPKNLVMLEGHHYFLTNVRRDHQFRFFVAYVLLKPSRTAARRTLFPRIFYKDSSLIWRVATHYINSKNEHWIGKGDIKPVVEDGEINWYSAEETTNLPFEIQTALDQISRRVKAPRPDRQALSLVLRNAPDNRVAPYADFSTPRRQAMSNTTKSIYNNRKVAWFEDDTNPDSLRFKAGFAPDFKHGLIAASQSRSKLYGGDILRFRIVSENRRIQYVFMHAPRQSWIIPPQPTALDIMSFGVHTVDAHVDENLCIPGFEYHFPDEDEPDGVFSQIPKGFAGASSPIDPQRADASPWTHRMPVIKAFHKALPALKKRARKLN